MRRCAILLTGTLLLLMGCSFTDIPDAKPTTGRAPTVAEVPTEDETVRGAKDPPIVTLDIGSQLRERKLARSEKLPGGIIVPTTNLSAVPVTLALQAVLEGTDVSLSWDAEAFDDRLVSVTNLSGPLPEVVDKICASAKVFCSFRSGLLELRDKETFIVELPAVPSLKEIGKAASNTMADMIGTLAGEKVRVDSDGGKLVYTTDVLGQENVREYLAELRHGRPLLVMQLYIWEVKLSKDNATGINWTNFSFPSFGDAAQKIALAGSTAFSDVTTPGMSLGATLSGNVTAEGVLKFLATQGQVQTISNPQLTFVSGSSAEFRVGGTQRYISQVGESTTSVSSSSSSSNTVSTDEIETGLKVTMGGAYEGGVVSAVMELEMEDVISLNPTKMEDGKIVDLPETTERKVSTSLRVRPGDNLVLAGLVSSRDTNKKEGIRLPFGMTIPSYRKDDMENSELVILVKPSIVLFADKSGGKDKEEAEASSRPSRTEPLPDAVLIDKDGAQSVSLSALKPAARKREEPETVFFAPPSQQPQSLLSAIPVEASADGAPVDNRLMQRGFSHAFDEMLTPSGAEGAR